MQTPLKVMGYFLAASLAISLPIISSADPGNPGIKGSVNNIQNQGFNNNGQRNHGGWRNRGGENSGGQNGSMGGPRSNGQPSMSQGGNREQWMRDHPEAAERFRQNHPEMAEQMRQREWSENHPNAGNHPSMGSGGQGENREQWMRDHPEASERFRQNHPEMAEQMRQRERSENHPNAGNHPSMGSGGGQGENREQWMREHPEAAERFFQNHPEAAERFRQNHPEMAGQMRQREWSENHPQQAVQPHPDGGGQHVGQGNHGNTPLYMGHNGNSGNDHPSGRAFGRRR